MARSVTARKAEPSRRRWASLSKAAEYFDCSPSTMRAYIAAGDVPAYYVGKRHSIKVDLNDLDALMRRIPAAS